MNPPLLPLSPIERLGWMRHFESLRCRRSFPGFTASRHYPMATQTIRVTSSAPGLWPATLRPPGSASPATFTGCELMIVLTADNGWRHRFLAVPKKTHTIIHSFEFLVEHFHIPQVPDVAALNPKGFETFKARLRALES